MATAMDPFSMAGAETPEQVLARLSGDQRAAIANALSKVGTYKTRKEQVGAAIGTALGAILRAKFDKPQDSQEYKDAQSRQQVLGAFSGAYNDQSAAPAMSDAQQRAANGEVAQAVGYPVSPQEAQKAVVEAGQAAGSGVHSYTKSQIAGYDAAIQKAKELGQPQLMQQLIQARDAFAQKAELDAANLEKLYADTGKAKADTGEALAKTTEIQEGGAPPEFAFNEKRLVALQTKRETVPDGTTAAKYIDAQISDLRDRQKYLTEHVGRTEFDSSAKGPSPSDLFKTTTALATNRDNLQRVAQMYDPAFLTASGRAKGWLFKAEDLAGMNLGDKDRSYLQNYSNFHGEAIRSLNQYIHDLTGAQMSQPEAERLRKAVADAERSGPAEFSARFQEAYKMAVAAANRWDDVLKAPAADRFQIMSRPLDSYIKDVQLPDNFTAKASGKVEKFQTPQGEVTVEWH